MYSGTRLVWSPVGPHVQWNPSSVVTYGTSLVGLDRWLCLLRLEYMYKTHQIWDNVATLEHGHPRVVAVHTLPLYHRYIHTYVFITPI